MELLKSASNVLQRHLPNVALYLAVTVVLSLAGSAFTIYQTVLNPDPDVEPTLASNAMRIAWFTAYSAIAAIAQCVVFSRIGREIDRPLWKVRDDREALQRFYMMWFEFNLVANTAFWIAGTPFGEGEIQALNVLATFIAWALVVILVPFGTCQMFLGSFSWQTFGDGLGPLSRRPIEFAPVFGITILQCIFGTYVGLLTQPDGTETSTFALITVARLACDLAIAYLDCLVFTAAWLVCKDDRDSPDEIDLDF
ncbi:MAG: hypothetical protein HUU46_10905 [Candidatus Hydrogenedentes bacterium]|nr:hypothetical protein [Candidatus Hydrogenedentota bacterium]